MDEEYAPIQLCTGLNRNQQLTLVSQRLLQEPLNDLDCSKTRNRSVLDDFSDQLKGSLTFSVDDG